MTVETKSDAFERKACNAYIYTSASNAMRYWPAMQLWPTMLKRSAMQ